MPKTAANAAPPKERRRAWYRLHASTWLAVVLLMVVLVLLIVPGESSEVDHDENGYAVATTEHGWPLVYLERRHYSRFPWTGPPDGVPWLNGANWRFSVERAKQISRRELRDPVQFGPWKLTANTITGLLILAVAGAACEWRRRRYGRVWQFSLRELCVVVLLCAAVLGWWRMHSVRSRREAEAVEEILSATGGVIYHGVDVAASYCGNRCIKRYLGPKWLRKLLGDKPLADFFAVSEVWILDTNGEELQRFWDPLSRMGYLEELTLLDSNGNNSDLERLGELKSLRILRLYLLRITDEGLVHLKGLPNLRELGIMAP